MKSLDGRRTLEIGFLWSLNKKYLIERLKREINTIERKNGT